MELYNELFDILPTIISFCDIKQVVSLFSLNKYFVQIQNEFLNKCTMEQILAKTTPKLLARTIVSEYRSRESFNHEFRYQVYNNPTFKVSMRGFAFKINILENEHFWQNETIKKLDLSSAYEHYLPSEVREKIKLMSIVKSIQDRNDEKSQKK